MKIDWFGATPGPTESWSRTLRWVVALAQHHEVCLWTYGERPSESVELKLPGTVALRCYPEPDSWRWLNRGDLAVYQVGDQPDHHMGAWAISREHRGVLVLESESLHRVVYWWFRHRSLSEEYVTLMRRLFGRLGSEAARYAIRDPREVEVLRQRYPLLGFAVENALGVVLPSPALLAQARNWGCPAAYSPIPSKAASGVVDSEHGMECWLHRFEGLAARALDLRCLRALSGASRGIDPELFSRPDSTAFALTEPRAWRC